MGKHGSVRRLISATVLISSQSPARSPSPSAARSEGRSRGYRREAAFSSSSCSRASTRGASSVLRAASRRVRRPPRRRSGRRGKRAAFGGRSRNRRSRRRCCRLARTTGRRTYRGHATLLICCASTSWRRAGRRSTSGRGVGCDETYSMRRAHGARRSRCVGLIYRRTLSWPRRLLRFLPDRPDPSFSLAPLSTASSSCICPPAATVSTPAAPNLGLRAPRIIPFSLLPARRRRPRSPQQHAAPRHDARRRAEGKSRRLLRLAYAATVASHSVLPMMQTVGLALTLLRKPLRSWSRTDPSRPSRPTLVRPALAHARSVVQMSS